MSSTQFAILRTAKVKSAASMRGSLRHSFREQTTPNANPELLAENSHFGAETVDEAMTAFRDRLAQVDGNIRKNAVLGIEYLVTGSPERIAQMNRSEQDAYFQDALEWLRDRHGAENVVYAGIHRDETTPHLYAYAVPLEERENAAGEKIQKLNARGFLGGTKHVLSELQTEFAEKIGQKHGLERGVKGSRATHQTIGEFYGKLDDNYRAKPLPKREVYKKTLLSRVEQDDESYARSVANHVRHQEGPTTTQVTMARNDERRAKSTALALDQQLKRVGDPRDLDDEHAAKLARETARLQKEQKEKRELARQERDRKRERDRGRSDRGR